MEPTMERLLDFLALSESAVLAAGGVFVRISALAFLVPGFGERTIPMRVKLGAALAFAVIVWPAIAIDAPPMTATFDSLGPVYAAEATVGLILGLSLRFLVFALQTAGTLIAQNLSLTQAFGTGVAPDPEATMGTILTLAADRAGARFRPAYRDCGALDRKLCGAALRRLPDRLGRRRLVDRARQPGLQPRRPPWRCPSYSWPSSTIWRSAPSTGRCLK